MRVCDAFSSTAALGTVVPARSGDVESDEFSTSRLRWNAGAARIGERVATVVQGVSDGFPWRRSSHGTRPARFRTCLHTRKSTSPARGVTVCCCWAPMSRTKGSRRGKSIVPVVRTAQSLWSRAWRWPEPVPCRSLLACGCLAFAAVDGPTRLPTLEQLSENCRQGRYRGYRQHADSGVTLVENTRRVS